jgi:acetyl/propionyl-CoA carboxylase alpha subunit
MALHLTLNGERHAIEILARKPHLVLRVDGRAYEIAQWSNEALDEMVIQTEAISVARAFVDDSGRETCFIRVDGRSHEVVLIDPRAELAGDDATRDEIHAPMPGAIVSVHRKAGERVARGETIITIESMKLQTALVAPRDGHLRDVLKNAGDTFDKDELLARLEPADEA